MLRVPTDSPTGTRTTPPWTADLVPRFSGALLLACLALGLAGPAAGQAGVVLRVLPHEATYRAGLTAELLDGEGTVLETQEREVVLDVTAGPDSVRIRVDPEDGGPVRRWAAGARGLHVPGRWTPGDWMAPALPLVRLPEEPVAVGDRWTVRTPVVLTDSELEGGEVLDYRVTEVDGARVSLSFSGRATAARRLEAGEVGTGRPVILNARTRRSGSAVFDREAGRVASMRVVDELRVMVEPLDYRGAGDEGQELLQRVRVTAEIRES